MRNSLDDTRSGFVRRVYPDAFFKHAGLACVYLHFHAPSYVPGYRCIRMCVSLCVHVFHKESYVLLPIGISSGQS